MNKKPATMVRVTSLAKTMETIENTTSLLNDDQKMGALIALNALRKEYGIPLSPKED